MMADAPRFVPLTAELLDWALVEQAAETDKLDDYRADPAGIAQLTRPPNRGEALIGRGRVLAAAGLILRWPGRAEAWMLVSPFATKADRVRAVRRCRAAIDAAQGDARFRRVEMTVLAEAPWRQSFAGYLGFTAEGLVRAWDPLGRDHVMYARIAGAV